MVYKIESSERLRHSASDMETKAMLYLMNFQNDSNDIYYFIVDFFNDLTGMDRMSQRLWDLQSKGSSNSSPKAIGKELVTLFKNFISEFTFDYYILFMGGVSNSVRIDSKKNVFNISNILPKSQIKLIEGLSEEAYNKTYIDDSKVTKENIEFFLNKVLFVLDDKPPCEYIKAIIRTHPSIIPDDNSLTGIFNEIRDQQASKKNCIPVEGITIQTPDEALNYCRHLTNNEIKLFILGRIINRNPFEKGVPTSFIPIYSQFPPESQRVNLENCQLALSRALFDKNGADIFWKLLEEVYRIIISNPNDNIDSLFLKLDSDIKNKSTNFDVLSLKYFIAGIKDGVQA